MGVMQYLDDKGLKALAKLLNFGRKKIWHGTRSEWDKLPAEEQLKYDQAEIEEDDGNNGNGVVYVADKVEKGNYNPVTSNAVYNSKLHTIKYNQDVLTGETWIDGSPVYRRYLQYGFEAADTSSKYGIETVKIGDLGQCHVKSIHGCIKLQLANVTRYISFMGAINALNHNNAEHANNYTCFVDENGEVYIRRVADAASTIAVCIEYTKQGTSNETVDVNSDYIPAGATQGRLEDIATAESGYGIAGLYWYTVSDNGKVSLLVRNAGTDTIDKKDTLTIAASSVPVPKGSVQGVQCIDESDKSLCGNVWVESDGSIVIKQDANGNTWRFLLEYITEDK